MSLFGKTFIFCFDGYRCNHKHLKYGIMKYKFILKIQFITINLTSTGVNTHDQNDKINKIISCGKKWKHSS